MAGATTASRSHSVFTSCFYQILLIVFVFYFAYKVNYAFYFINTFHFALHHLVFYILYDVTREMSLC